MRKLLATLAIGAMLAFTAPAYSQVHLRVHFGPPSLRVETVAPAPAPNMSWVPGYYRFDALTNDYVWVPGSWQYRPSQNVVWIPPEYIQRGDHYDYIAGHWGTRGELRAHLERER